MLLRDYDYQYLLINPKVSAVDIVYRCLVVQGVPKNIGIE